MATIAQSTIRKKQDGDWMWINCEFWRSYAWRLSPVAVRVYGVLATHANNTTQTTFLHQQTIANEAHCTERAARKALDQVEKSGLIATERTRRGNRYTLLLPGQPEQAFRFRSETTGTDVPVQPEQAFLSDRNRRSCSFNQTQVNQTQENQTMPTRRAKNARRVSENDQRFDEDLMAYVDLLRQGGTKKECEAALVALTVKAMPS